MGKAMTLTIEGEAFAGMRYNANTMLAETLETMMKKNCDRASLTIKVNLKLGDAMADDPEELRYHAEREIVVPLIEHKITSVMQIKDESKGEIGGAGYELVKEGGRYLLKKVGPEQVSFDDDDAADIETANDEPETLGFPEAIEADGDVYDDFDFPEEAEGAADE